MADGKVGLETREIFLDTEVYRRQTFNLNARLLKALKAYIEQGVFSLHIADITHNEIAFQLREEADKHATLLEQAGRALERWRERDGLCGKVTLPSFDAAQVAREAATSFQATLMMDWSAQTHDASEMAATNVFKDYFERKPPFHGKERKEFPDAFVVHFLAEWCRRSKKKMYVVSGDHAFRDAASATDVLIPIKDLPTLLQAAAAASTPDIVSIAEKFLSAKKVLKKVARAIDDSIQNMGVTYDGWRAEGEVLSVSRNGEIEIDDHYVMSATQNDLTVLLQATVPIRFNLLYEDRSDAIYDREDGIYFGAENSTAELNDSVPIRIVVLIDRNTGEALKLDAITDEIVAKEYFFQYE